MSLNRETGACRIAAPCDSRRQSKCVEIATLQTRVCHSLASPIINSLVGCLGNIHQMDPNGRLLGKSGSSTGSRFSTLVNSPLLQSQFWSPRRLPWKGIRRKLSERGCPEVRPKSMAYCVIFNDFRFSSKQLGLYMLHHTSHSWTHPFNPIYQNV